MNGKTVGIACGRMALGIMLAATLLAWAALPAQAPAVSVDSLSWTQKPGDLSGTKIEIRYALTSPNADCRVSAKLSKGNGAPFDVDINPDISP